MAIDPKLVSIIPASQLPTGDPTSAADFLFYEGDALKKGSMSNIYDKVSSGINGVATQTNAPTAWVTGDPYLFERWVVNAPITSPNSWGNIAVTADELKDNLVFFNVTDGVVEKQSVPVKSAYDVAVINGFPGTEAEWLESLKANGAEWGLGATYPVIVDESFTGGTVGGSSTAVLMFIKEIDDVDLTKITTPGDNVNSVDYFFLNQYRPNGSNYEKIAEVAMSLNKTFDLSGLTLEIGDWLAINSTAPVGGLMYQAGSGGYKYYTKSSPTENLDTVPINPMTSWPNVYSLIYEYTKQGVTNVPEYIKEAFDNYKPKIASFVDGDYLAGSQVLDNGRFWIANANTVTGDIPGVSTKWDDLKYAAYDDVFKVVNIMNPSLFQFGFYYSDGTGTLDAKADAAVSGKQKVSPNTQYSLATTIGAYNRIEYDIDGNFISSAPGIGLANTFTTSANTHFVSYSWYSGINSTNFPSLKNRTILNKGTVTSYVPYGEITLADVFHTDIITIATADKIGVLGNSYTNGYSMKGKNYLNILSMWSDYQFRNFGLDGDDLTEITARVNANETRLGVVPFKSWGITYGIIADRDNNDPTDVNAYYNDVKKLCEILENLGVIPILSTEHQLQQGMNWFGAFERLHREKGYMFMNWGHAAYSLDAAYFSPFWYNRHPATRTMWNWANGMQKYLRTLPRPKKGLKLFRVRTGVDTSTVNNLVYSDNYGRADKFNEIAIGQRAITSATEKYFDRMNNPSVAFEDVLDEYQYLQNKTDVSFGTHALLEVILPYDFKSTRKCEINITATGITNAYIKKTINSVDSFIEVPIVSGKIVLTDLSGAMMYDKIAILLKGSAISISDIEAKAVGTEYKTQITKPFVKRRSGPSLLTDSLLDDGTSWVNVNSLPKVDKIVNPLDPAELEYWPYLGINTVRLISNTNFLTQTLLPFGDDFWTTETPRVQVRVICRYFPEYVDTDAKFATTVINPDSLDTVDLELSLKGEFRVNPVPFALEKVGLGWQEIIVETMLSDVAPILNIKCKTPGKFIQAGKVEVIKLIE